MKTKKWISLAVGMVMVGWAAAALAGPGWGMGPGRGGMLSASMASQLGLTAEQSAQLQAMREKHAKEIAPLREQLMTKRQELQALWAEPNPDASKITAKQREIAELRSKMQEMSTRHRLEARSILTPEQQKKFAEMVGSGQGFARGKGRMAQGW